MEPPALRAAQRTRPNEARRAPAGPHLPPQRLLSCARRCTPPRRAPQVDAQGSENPHPSAMVRARHAAERGAWLAAQRTADAVKAVRSAARLDARPLLLASQVTPALLLLQARSLSPGLPSHGTALIMFQRSMPRSFQGHAYCLTSHRTP